MISESLTSDNLTKITPENRIFAKPYQLQLNQYCGNLFRAFRTHGFNVYPIEDLYSSISNKSARNIVLLGWMEDSVAKHKRRHCNRELWRTLKLLLKIKQQKKTIIWVKHNLKPHQLPHAHWLGKCYHIFLKFLLNRIAHHKFAHSQLFCNSNPTFSYIPHPVYEIKPSDSVIKYDGIIAGRIMRYKGVLDLLRHWPLEKSLAIAGTVEDPTLEKEIRDLILKRKLTVLCRFEFINDDALNLLLSQSRFVVVPNKKDSMIASGVIIHALSARKHVLASDTDYAKELQANGYPVTTFSQPRHIGQCIERANNLNNNEAKFNKFFSDHSDEKIYELFMRTIDN